VKIVEVFSEAELRFTEEGEKPAWLGIDLAGKVGKYD